MPKTALKFRMHRAVITLVCLFLIAIIMQTASYFGRGHAHNTANEVDELALILAKQVAYSLAPLLQPDGKEIDIQRINAIIEQLTLSERILDANVYQLDGTLVTRAGESVTVRDRLALDGMRAGSYFNHQIVEMIPNKKEARGFLRITLDTHHLATEAKQVDNTTNLLRLMFFLSLIIGIILGRTLLRFHHSRWQQSPYLLTANAHLTSEPEPAEERDHS